jgi:hypothetical protein|tara:strand:+ start:2351 stop:2605 length:255 start_codon:yes stop_codon:yes gene_type:complete
MAKFEAHEEIIETMVDFKKGLRTLDTGTKVLAEQTGLEDDVARALLRGMNKSYSTVTQIRGYSKEKPYQIEGKNKKRLLKKGAC